MSPMMFRVFSLLAIALAAASAQVKARAETLSAADTLQIQAVVAAQLAALAQDDAERAFATATPQVRDQVGSAARFLSLVRSTYPMVYRNAGTTFLAPEEDNGQVVQVVQIRDHAQNAWVALFAVQRQQDQSWRIGSCLVAQAPGKAT